MELNRLKEKTKSYAARLGEGLDGSPRRLVAFVTQMTLMRKLLALAILVGLLTGLVSVLFQWLIGLIWGVSYGAGASEVDLAGRWTVLVIPAIGGLIIGPMVTYLASEAKGHGVPEVMLAVARREGRIRPIVAAVKSIASSICIGTGGSAGKEGPIVQIGSAFGSTVGQLFQMSGGMTKMLVACGAAGGIAATFGTPIAGVLFSMEVILQQFATASFSMVVISAVTASAVSRLILGEQFFFHVPRYTMNSHWELFLYAGMGVVGALYARGFVKILYGTEGLFERMRFPEWLKPALGGLCLGALGFFLPAILGTGHHVTQEAMWGRLTIGTLLILSVAKIFATSFTLGSGGSGGVFSPSLFIGAMMGGCFGHLLHGVLPGVVSTPGAYALVGMGAVFAGATRAPITAILIIFEMTNDYHIILPVMIAVVVSTLVSAALSEETIYTLKLLRRGIRLGASADDVIARLSVRDVMTRNVETIRPDMPLHDLVDRIHVSAHDGFPVVDAEGKLVGLIDTERVRDALPVLHEVGEVVVVGEMMLAPSPVATPDEPLTAIAERLKLKGIEHLPVVAADDRTRLVGIITNHDILGAYCEKREDQREATFLFGM